MNATITVISPGLSTISDLGRVRAAHVGQMTGGALDQYSAEMANTLVASPRRAPVLELVAQDFTAVASADLLIAVTGAVADVELDGWPQVQWEPLLWRRGEKLTIRRIRAGVRVYVAMYGRVQAPELLGSCAPDTVLGFGMPLRAGSVLCVSGTCPDITQPSFGIPFFLLGARPHWFSGTWHVDVTDGPDLHEFGDTARRLAATSFRVGPSSNHIGLRLAPETANAALPRRTVSTEVLSRGVPIGAVEVPTGEEILVLHRGRGVTAGYPVLAVVTQVGLSRLGQARPGDTVQFRFVSLDQAVAAYREQQAHVADVRRRVCTAFSSLHIPVHFDNPPDFGSAPSPLTTHLVQESA